MRTSTVHSILTAFKIRSLLAVSAVGLAIIPAVYEHNTREILAQSQAQAPKEGAVPAPETAPEADKTFSLSPDTGILDMVAERIQGKPSFDHKAGNYEQIIKEAAEENSVSPVLVKAVIQAESRFNSHAVSAQGAVGLMQILPATARSMGFSSPQIPRDNVRAGVRYLRVLLNEFGNEEALAIAAYNCGPDKVRRYGNQMPPITETRHFVSQVMEYYQSHIDS
ncbi:MAG: lytic transglycosylase domain-containing protein [Deltaproteobacteria bacterium]|jgi:soluble lytic murein transglycosylase-like protein|nr:lytic transglycosylase domain-containing protein [Deltaproteobacteria bacterium]